MKLGPVTKIDKKNKTTSKKIDDNVMSENCDVFVIFRILANLERSGGGCYVFSDSNLFVLQKLKIELKNL